MVDPWVIAILSPFNFMPTFDPCVFISDVNNTKYSS